MKRVWMALRPFVMLPRLKYLTYRKRKIERDLKKGQADLALRERNRCVFWGSLDEKREHIAKLAKELQKTETAISALQ